jgi:hypothetical protein
MAKVFGGFLVVVALIAPPLATTEVSARAACPMRLDAVEAVAVDLVWIGGTGCGRSLIEVWDGSRWRVSWAGPASGGTVSAIAANTADEAWAVGEQWSARLDRSVPLILRSDGSAWLRVAAPWRSTQAWLSDVDVRGSEVWAAGEGPDARPLVIRWTGAEFERVPMPLLGSGSGGLTGLALTGDGRVWVVDGYGRAFVRSDAGWRESPLPDLPRQVAAARSIDAGGQLLAVGDTGYFPEAGPDTRALSTRWSGSRWVVDRLGPVGELDDVEVISPDRAWAVGCAGRDVGCYSNRFSPLVMRRNADGVWRSVPVPSVGWDSALASVDAYGTLGVWAVGRWVDRAGDNHPLVYHREGGEWVRTDPVIFL